MCTLNEATMQVASEFKENAPLIGIIFGVGSLIASGVVAAVSARKVDKILDDHKDHLSDIKKAKENKTIDEKTASREVAKCYGHTAWKMFRAFAPSVTLAVVGCTSIGWGYSVEHSRLIDTREKLATTSAVLASTFSDFRGYRERTRARFGPEVDNELMYDIHKEEVEETVVDKKGNEKVVKKKETVMGPVGTPGFDIYAQWFNKDTSHAWNNNYELNKVYLMEIEDIVNDMLTVRGHLTVNDIYAEIGLKDEFDQPLRTKAGQVMGWINDPSKIRQIDFGMHEPINQDFWNGKSPNCLIIPIPEGNIWELLKD